MIFDLLATLTPSGPSSFGSAKTEILGYRKPLLAFGALFLASNNVALGVESHVSAMRRQEKVVQGIVELIAIYVMYVFRCKQLATKFFFNEHSVIANTFSILFESEVSVRGNSSKLPWGWNWIPIMSQRIAIVSRAITLGVVRAFTSVYRACFCFHTANISYLVRKVKAYS